jgi:O-antigen ligase
VSDAEKLQPSSLQSQQLPSLWLDTVLSITLFSMGAAVLLSVAAASILLALLTLLACLTAPGVRRLAPWREPLLMVGLVLLAYITLHTLWISGFTSITLRTINRYHELLFLPVLFVLFRLVSRKQAFIFGLCAGALGLSAAHWAALFYPSLAAELAPRRISAGFMLAVSAFVLFELARHASRPWIMRALAALLAMTVLFAVEGRTGHLVLLLLVICASWTHSPPRWRWVALVMFPLMTLAIASGSASVQKRMQETLTSLKTPNDPMSSSDIRIELTRIGVDLAQDHYATGLGYANYSARHLQAAHKRYAIDPQRKHYLQSHWVNSSNPHNEYLMQLVGGGIPALVLLLTWLSLPILRRAAPGTQALLTGVSLAFATGCLFNSLLMDFVEGHFYMALLAWLLARAADALPPERSSA